MLCSRENTRSVYGWNSIPSIGFDVIFGVIPAIWYSLPLANGFLALASNNFFYAIYYIFFLGVYIFPLCSLITVSLCRNKTLFKGLHIFLLSLGILVAVWLNTLTIFSSSMQKDSSFFYFLLLIPAIFVAVKHIFMLSRASEVQP